MLPCVDVRDLATAHILAITDPSLASYNGRYLMATRSLWFSEIVQTIAVRRIELGISRIKTRKIGSLGIYFAALVINQNLKQVLPFVNQPLTIRTAVELVEAMSGVDYIPIEDSLFETAQKLVELEKEASQAKS